MQYSSEQNQNQKQALEEQIFILQEQARKSQTVQDQILAQQTETQHLLAQLFNLVGSLQKNTEAAQAAQPNQESQTGKTGSETPQTPNYKSSIKLKSPEKWAGPSDKLNIISWAASVRNYLKHYNLLESTEGVTVVQSLLKGDAMTYYVHQTETMQYEFETASKLLDQLITWANPKYTQRNIREKIRNLRQNRNQPVFEYIAAYQQLMFVVKDMSLPDQLINFAEGLVPRIKQEVAKAGDEITLDEAYRIASACDESSNYAYKGSQHLRQPEMNFQPYLRRGTPMDVDNLDRKGQKTRNHPSLSKEEKENLVKNNGCFYCRKHNADHSARYCPEKRHGKNDQLLVDLEGSENDVESTSEEESDGYVVDANLVDSHDLKCAIDSHKNCILFNNKNNFYEPLFLLSSESEIREHKKPKPSKSENTDTPSPSEAMNLENRVQPVNFKGPKLEIEDRSDWQLNPKVAANIFKKWGEPDIDLFATQKNKQAPFYYRKPTPGLPLAEGCIGEDAFSASWDMNNTLYCNPPWLDISLVIEKIIRDKPKKIIIIAPENNRLKSMSTDTIQLPHTQNLFIPQSRQRNNILRGVGPPIWKKSFAYLITNKSEITWITNKKIQDVGEGYKKSESVPRLSKRDSRFLFNGNLEGKPGKILVDSGCTVNIISASFCKRHNIPTSKILEPIELTLANNETTTASISTQITITRNNYSRKIDCFVSNIKYDMMLGTPWLESIKIVDLEWRCNES
jgi:hypothetical protein